MLLGGCRRSRRHPDGRRARRRSGGSGLLVLLRFLYFAIAAHLTFCHDRTPFCMCARRNVRASTQCALNCLRCRATFVPISRDSERRIGYVVHHTLLRGIESLTCANILHPPIGRNRRLIFVRKQVILRLACLFMCGRAAITNEIIDNTSRARRRGLRVPHSKGGHVCSRNVSGGSANA